MVTSPPDPFGSYTYELESSHGVTSEAGTIATGTGNIVALDAETILTRRTAEVWNETDQSLWESGLSDNDPVTTWPSLSPASINPTQAVASKKPLFKENIFNGHPAIRFDGSDDELTATITARTARTIFVVGKFLTVNNNRIWSFAGDASIFGSGTTYFWYSNEVAGVVNIGGTATNPAVVGDRGAVRQGQGRSTRVTRRNCKESISAALSPCTTTTTLPKPTSQL